MLALKIDLDEIYISMNVTSEFSMRFKLYHQTSIFTNIYANDLEPSGQNTVCLYTCKVKQILIVNILQTGKCYDFCQDPQFTFWHSKLLNSVVSNYSLLMSTLLFSKVQSLQKRRFHHVRPVCCCNIPNFGKWTFTAHLPISSWHSPFTANKWQQIQADKCAWIFPVLL